MTGEGIEDTDYVIDIILKQIKPGFVKSAIKAELEETEAEIKAMKDEDIISVTNGMLHAYWDPNMDIAKYHRANELLDARNRLIHFLYHN